jgi:hypothetical protein
MARLNVIGVRHGPGPRGKLKGEHMNESGYQKVQREYRQYVFWLAVKKSLFALALGTILVLVFIASARADDNQFVVRSSEFRARDVETGSLQTFAVIPRLDATQKITYLTVLAMVDYRQTVDTVVAHPDQYYELNPALGPHPSRAALAAFGILGVGATALLTRVEHPLARIVVDSIIATEQINVYENQNPRGRRGLPIMIAASIQF